MELQAEFAQHSIGHVNCPACEETRLAMVTPKELAAHFFPKAAELWLASHSKHISARTIKDYKNWTSILARFFSQLTLQSIHIGHIEEYQTQRLNGLVTGKKVGPVAVNHELTVLVQILKRAGLWGNLAPHYQPLTIPRSTRGMALTAEQEARLFREATLNPRWRVAYWCALISANTTAGPGEIRALRIKDVMLNADPPCIHIREGIKNKHRDRYIPLNAEAKFAALQLMTRARKMGAELPDHYLLPHRASANGENPDPTRPAGNWWYAWDALRQKAGLPTLRMYDLRHHAITKLLENEDVSERTVIELAGHVSKDMLSRYSHIRMKTKYDAVSALNRKGAEPEPTPRFELVKR